MNLLLVLFVLFFYSGVACDIILPVQVIGMEDFYEFPSAGHNGISSTLFKSIIKYQCLVHGFHDSVLIIYGTKSWTFPAQDVNLTLTYPTEVIRNNRETFDDYVITGFKVHLYVDALQSRGNINDGGIWQDSISLSFTVSNITTLAYHLWIYGVPKQMTTVIDYVNVNLLNNTMC